MEVLGPETETENEMFYRAEGSGLRYDPAQARNLNYRCRMDGSRLVPTQETTWGTVSFSTHPWPARSGRTTVEVRPLESNGAPARDAEVWVTLNMPGMRMRSDDRVVPLMATNEGLYTVDVRLPMGGRWLATVTVKRGADAEAFRFEFDAIDEGANAPSAPPSRTDRPRNGSSWGGAKPELPAPRRPAAAAYTCPMHPDVIQASPGTCPRCGMDLVKKQ